MDVTSRFRVKIRRRRERIKERRGGTHGDYRRSIGYAAVKVKLQRAGWEVGGKRRNGHNAGLKVDNGHLRGRECDNFIRDRGFARAGWREGRGKEAWRITIYPYKIAARMPPRRVIKPINPRHKQPLTQILSFSLSLSLSLSVGPPVAWPIAADKHSSFALDFLVIIASMLGWTVLEFLVLKFLS